MYSPKIKEEFIIQLYKLAKKQKISMVALVNKIIHKFLNGTENNISNT